MAYKKIPVNIMEGIVDEKLDEQMNSSGMCCCEQCRADVKAIVLNKLPPRYVASISGDVFARFQLLDNQTQANITREILMAIAIVQRNPHHGESYK